MDNRPAIQEREQQPPLHQEEMLWTGDLCETPVNLMFPCVSLGSYLLPMRNDNCGAEGGTCNGRSSMAGLYTGKRGAVGQMKKSVIRKDGFMQYD